MLNLLHTWRQSHTRDTAILWGQALGSQSTATESMPRTFRPCPPRAVQMRVLAAHNQRRTIWTVFQCLIKFQEHLFHQVINSHWILRGFCLAHRALTFEAVTTATFLLDHLSFTPATHTTPHLLPLEPGRADGGASHSIQLSAGTKAAWQHFVLLICLFLTAHLKLGHWYKKAQYCKLNILHCLRPKNWHSHPFLQHL